LKILVVGGGAREHTLVWKLAQSPHTTGLFAVPGNAGTAQTAHNLDIRAEDTDALVNAVRKNGIELVVVGPEGPLAAGMVDRFYELGIPAFGPTRLAAEIESSKVFAKDLMTRHGIPCAHSVAFSDYSEARAYVGRKSPPVVIKADGLAAGKGVVVADSLEQALETLAEFMQSRRLGASGDRVVVEEYLSGREMSAFVFTDGGTVLPIASACDYKRAYDGDRGPNTGGMGSYSPPPFLTPELSGTVLDSIMKPTVSALAREGRTYRGVLYGGLMVTAEGPRVVEFNARLGDPETQVILPLLKTDLVDIMLAVMEGRLDRMQVECYQGACVGVVMASGGYPGGYQIGFPITGLGDLDEDVLVFHAGTRQNGGGREVLTAGGRVLTVVARGDTIDQARRKAYANVSRIYFQDCHYRKDIALVAES